MKIFLFPTLILNLDLFHELIPFNAGKTVIFMKSATEVYFSSSSVQNLNVATTKLVNILSRTIKVVNICNSLKKKIGNMLSIGCL
jgi:hypothetical protein